MPVQHNICTKTSTTAVLGCLGWPKIDMGRGAHKSVSSHHIGQTTKIRAWLASRLSTVGLRDGLAPRALCKLVWQVWGAEANVTLPFCY